MRNMKEIISPGTKVLIYSKSIGRDIEQVLNSKRQIPIVGWVKYYNVSNNSYSICYSSKLGGGDFYLRKDFEIIDNDYLDLDFDIEKDFEL